MMMTLGELVAAVQPESDPHEQETWLEIARRLWTEEPRYMHAMMRAMLRIGWIRGETGVVVHDGHVQNGHHRIVVGLALGWHDRPVPVKVLEVS